MIQHRNIVLMTAGALLLISWGCRSVERPDIGGPVKIAPDLSVLYGECGVFRDNPDKTIYLMPARTIQVAAGTRFGWVLYLNTTRKTVRWREQVTFPSRPRNLAVSEPSEGAGISADGRTMTTENQHRLTGNIISDVWEFEDGDPRGEYVFKIFIDNKPAGTFRIQVVP